MTNAGRLTETVVVAVDVVSGRSVEVVMLGNTSETVITAVLDDEPADEEPVDVMVALVTVPVGVEEVTVAFCTWLGDDVIEVEVPVTRVSDVLVEVMTECVSVVDDDEVISLPVDVDVWVPLPKLVGIEIGPEEVVALNPMVLVGNKLVKPRESEMELRLVTVLLDTSVSVAVDEPPVEVGNKLVNGMDREMPEEVDDEDPSDEVTEPESEDVGTTLSLLLVVVGNKADVTSLRMLLSGIDNAMPLEVVDGATLDVKVVVGAASEVGDEVSETAVLVGRSLVLVVEGATLLDVVVGSRIEVRGSRMLLKGIDREIPPSELVVLEVAGSEVEVGASVVLVVPGASEVVVEDVECEVEVGVSEVVLVVELVVVEVLVVFGSRAEVRGSIILLKGNESEMPPESFDVVVVAGSDVDVGDVVVVDVASEVVEDVGSGPRGGRLRLRFRSISLCPSSAG